MLRTVDRFYTPGDEATDDESDEDGSCEEPGNMVHHNFLNLSKASPIHGKQTLASPGLTAKSVLRLLLPHCSSAVLATLSEQRIRTPADLAVLDKDDLRDLGLGMLDRAHVRRWAQSFQTQALLGASPQGILEEVRADSPSSDHEARYSPSRTSNRSEASGEKRDASPPDDACRVPDNSFIPKPPASRLADRLFVLSQSGEPTKFRLPEEVEFNAASHQSVPSPFAAGNLDGMLESELDSLNITTDSLDLPVVIDAGRRDEALGEAETARDKLVHCLAPWQQLTCRKGSASKQAIDGSSHNSRPVSPVGYDVGKTDKFNGSFKPFGLGRLNDALCVSELEGRLVTSRSETLEHLQLPGSISCSDGDDPALRIPGRPTSAPAKYTEAEGFREVRSKDTSPHFLQSVHKGKRLPADFWCDIMANSWANQDPAERIKTRSRVRLAQDNLGIRQYMLEELFDVTTERLSKVYKDMRKHSFSGKVVHAAALELGLRRCGLHGFSELALDEIVKMMASSPEKGLTLREFQIIVARLKLAQLLTSKSEALEHGSTSAMIDGTCKDKDATCLQVEPATQFEIVDYNSARMEERLITDEDLGEFLFANRRGNRPWGANIIRWVHFEDLKFRALLGLTIKYSLHPSGVEDVINQSPAKLDRYGNNYFVATQLLNLVSPGDGSEPVRIAGTHLAAFCCGPPAFDTIITVVQSDMTFAQDWPEAEAMETVPQEWVEKLKQRLEIPRSRLRERQTDFLFYHLLDLATSQIVAVTRAFSARLIQLDMTLQRYMQDMWNSASSSLGHRDSSAELLNTKVQLLVVVRRLKGLHQIVSDLMRHGDISSSVMNNLQTVARRLKDAEEDAVHLSDMCSHITKTNQSWLQFERENRKDEQSDKLNRLLFVLTTGTFVLAPIQLFAGVYGMNFVGKDGSPGIPELRHQDGYTIFWVLTLVYFALVVIALACFFRGRKTSFAILRLCSGRKTCCLKCHRSQRSCESTSEFV